MIKILVVDDHPVVRRGIKHIVEEDPGMKVTGEASTGADAFTLLAKQPFDVVVLDLSLPQENGLEIFDVIKTRHSGIPVLILSMYPEENYAVRAIKAGAAGYLCKDSMSEILVSAIKKVISGGKFITPSLAEKLAVHLESREKPLHDYLSHREFRVMHMLALGKNLREIGEELNLSIKTVSTYKTRIFEKMQFQNNAELVKYALQFNLVETFNQF